METTRACDNFAFKIKQLLLIVSKRRILSLEKRTTQFSLSDQLNLRGTFLLNRGYGGMKMFFILVIVHSTLRFLFFILKFFLF